MEDGMKNFTEHFYMLCNKLREGQRFAFSRFSDGELRIMENKELVLGPDFNKIGNRRRRSHYEPEDRKHFDPEKHQHVRDKLMEAYCYHAHNYYVGLSCKCCVGVAAFNKMVEWRGGDDEYLTWANLWVNANYPLFVKYMIPEFSHRDIVLICNQNANIHKLPFNVKQVFFVGDNCIVNDFGIWERIKEWMDLARIHNHVFLFSASSLSNMIIYELYKHAPYNTYIDIGTTLNPYMGMKAMRGYLTGKNRKQCVW